jgi:hypothetical protein
MFRPEITRHLTLQFNTGASGFGKSQEGERIPLRPGNEKGFSFQRDQLALELHSWAEAFWRSWTPPGVLQLKTGKMQLPHNGTGPGVEHLGQLG